jgi:hypothetical protein
MLSSIILGASLAESLLDPWAHQRFAPAADEIYLAVLGTVVRIKPGWKDRS